MAKYSRSGGGKGEGVGGGIKGQLDPTVHQNTAAAAAALHLDQIPIFTRRILMCNALTLNELDAL